MTTKTKRYWVIQRVNPHIIVTGAGNCGVLFAYRTKREAVAANGGSRKDVVCYWQTVK